MWRLRSLRAGSSCVTLATVVPLYILSHGSSSTANAASCVPRCGVRCTSTCTADVTQLKNTSKCTVPVDQALIEEVTGLLQDAQSPMPLSVLYEKLSLATKRQHVKPHKSLLNALRSHTAAQQSSGCLAVIKVSDDGVTAELANVGSIPSPSSASEAVVSASESLPLSAQNADIRMPENPLIFSYFRADVDTQLAKIKSSATRLQGVGNDFYFGVLLNELPPPPPNVDASTATKLEGLEAAAESSIKITSLTRYIPTFFVPVADVVQCLPEGYTEEHIETYLSVVKTVQLVTVAGVRYIRIFGGYGQVTLDECGEAAATFLRYQPDPKLLPAFVAAFEGIRDRWMPLALLLQRAGEETASKLPYAGAAAILFFAQMQHVFGFSPDNGGSVLLKQPYFSGLQPDSTPVPQTFAFILNAIPMDEFVALDTLQAAVPAHINDELLKFFPSLEYFLRSHGSTFYVCGEVPATNSEGPIESTDTPQKGQLQVCRMRYKERLDRKQLPLEEQLELAYKEGRKKCVRSIRRKMALANNANSPYLDKTYLAREIHKALPKRGHVRIKYFLRGQLPDEILNFMPKNYLKFFLGFPDLFQVFELRDAGSWCVTRAGLSLPPGVLRKEYSDDDIVRVLAQLVSRKGPKPLSALFLNVPEGVHKAIKSRHVDMYHFALKHSEYFSLVEPFDRGNAKSAAILHLVKLPTDLGASVETEGEEFVGNEEDDDE